MAPTSVGLAALDQNDVVLLPQLIQRHTMRGSVVLTTVLQQQQPLSQMTFLAYTNYAMSPSQVSLYLSELSLSPIHNVICWCLLWYLLSAFRFPFSCHVHHGGSTAGFAMMQSHGVYPWQAYVFPGDCGVCQECTEWLFHPLL